MRGRQQQLTIFFDEMNKASDGTPSRRRVREIFETADPLAIEASASVTFLTSRFATGDFTLQQIQDLLQDLDFPLEEINSFMSGFRNVTERTLLALKTSALVLSARRVSPRWRSFGSAIEFKPVSRDGKLRALVPFVNVKLTFLDGTRKTKETLIELSIIDLMILRSYLGSLYGRLKRETVHLSEKMGDIVISPETVDMMYPLKDDV